MNPSSLLLCLCGVSSLAHAGMPTMPTESASTTASSAVPATQASPDTPITTTTAATATTTTTVAPVAMAVAPVTATASATPDYKPDIEQINQQIKLIGATKDALKLLLTEMDSDIEKAKGIVSAARASSLKALKQTNEKEAKELEAAVQAQLVEVSTLQKKLTDVSAKTFKENTEKIEQAIKQINTSMELLKAKGAKFEAVIKSSTVKAAPQAVAPTQKNWAIPASNNTAAATQAPTVVHYILYKTADAISSFARVLYGAYTGAKEAIVGTTQQQANKKDGAPAATPAPSTAPGAIPQSLPASTASNKPVSLAAHESALAAIEGSREAMTITLRNLDLQVQDLASALASSKQISQELLGVLPLISKTHPQEAWRASAQYYFDQSLDAAALMYGTTKRAVSSAYANYIEPLFNKVKTDVAAKMTPANQPATQPDMPPIPTSAA